MYVCIVALRMAIVWWPRPSVQLYPIENFAQESLRNRHTSHLDSLEFSEWLICKGVTILRQVIKIAH